MLVNNQKSGYLGQGCGKDWTHKGSVSHHTPKKPAFCNTHTQILGGEMLRNHLVHMQPSPSRGILPWHKTGQLNPVTSNSNTWRISVTKVSEHNSMSYWDEDMVKSLRFLARPRTLLQSTLQTAGSGCRWSGFCIQIPWPQASIKNKIEKIHNYCMFTIQYTKDGGRAVCDRNITTTTNQTHNPALTVWFYKGRKKSSLLSQVRKGEEWVSGRSGLRLWL